MYIAVAQNDKCSEACCSVSFIAYHHTAVTSSLRSETPLGETYDREFNMMQYFGTEKRFVQFTGELSLRL